MDEMDKFVKSQITKIHSITDSPNGPMSIKGIVTSAKKVLSPSCFTGKFF